MEVSFLTTCLRLVVWFFFFFIDPAPPETSPLPLPAPLPISTEPIQQTILNTPVVEDAAENCLAPAQIQNFLVAFYPIIRDFPQWLQLLLDRSPDDGRAFFEDNIRVERRHDAMWRVMGDGFDVPRERFVRREPIDRKSTRLNSSHSQNSYAVF